MDARDNLEVASSTVLEDYIADKGKVIIYTFVKEKILKSNCYSDCDTTCPPLLYTGTSFPTIGTGLNKDLIFLPNRTDGTSKLPTMDRLFITTRMKILQGLNISKIKNMNGGYWWVISPSAAIVLMTFVF